MERLEEKKKNGELFNMEIVLFTESMVAEYGFYKGNLSYKILFDLIMRL